VSRVHGSFDVAHVDGVTGHPHVEAIGAQGVGE
jgi:hypothetical protein